MAGINECPTTMRRTRPRGPAFIMVLALWAVALYGAFLMVTAYAAADHIGFDAHAYWAGARRTETYAIAPGHRDAYLYSPAFLHLIFPLTRLPWLAFFAVWVAIQTACFWWLTRPLGAWWQVPVILFCLPEILYGNIHGLLGLMLCLGMRRPGLWTFAILTKVTLGAVGVVWFLARKDWKALREVATVTALVLLVSTTVDPTAWLAWIEFLSTTGDQESNTSRILRLVVVLLVVAYAARTDRRWLLPAAMLAAAPRFSLHLKDLSLLAATVRLKITQRADDEREG